MSQRMTAETMPDGSALFRAGTRILHQGNTRVFALIEHVASGISDAVLRDERGWFFRIVSVLGGRVEGQDRGEAHEQVGWYLVEEVSELDANLLRQSWTLLVRQPDAPDAIRGD